jgi:hypothetical protein
MEIIIVVVVILGILGILLENPAALVAVLIVGGIGYALGNIASSGWGIFGAILGALIGWTGAKENAV